MNELSKVGNRAIHELAARKGWQEGSEEKILAHSIFGGLLSSLAGGKIATGTLAGGVGEYVNGRILAAKGKAWVEKHPDLVQTISAAVGSAVGAVTGESSIGSNVSLGGTKWNDINSIISDVKDSIAEMKENASQEVWNEARYLIDNGYIIPKDMKSDYYVVSLGIGEGIKAGSVGCTIDKYGNVYGTIAFVYGKAIGNPITSGSGWMSSIDEYSLEGYRDRIVGWGGSLTLIGGIGGSIGLSSAGIVGEIKGGFEVEISGSIGYTFYVGNIYNNGDENE